MLPPPYGPGSYTGMSEVVKCAILSDIRMSETARQMSAECRATCGPGSYTGMSDLTFKMSDLTFKMSDVTFGTVLLQHFTTAAYQM